MTVNATSINGHRRASSSSTVRAAANNKGASMAAELLNSRPLARATLWVHDDSFSSEEILINPSLLAGSQIGEGSLVELAQQAESTDVLDFEETTLDPNDQSGDGTEQQTSQHAAKPDTCLCIVKFATAVMLAKHQGLEVSLTKTIAEAFKLHSREQVVLKSTSYDYWTASHIEFSFRDAYLARSDMWRLVSQELANKVVYRGQKITFLGTLKLTVKEIHLKGHRVHTGFFAATTIPIFRSEAARYVLFIQMSREMWDFDSEGNGEIMFNRVINGFLPDLFRRWVELEVRHLVSIVLFGRQEYNRYDFDDSNPGTATDRFTQSSTTTNPSSKFHQDFFRVVITDMASAQWTTILNELKKDFQVFLRDISLHTPAMLPFGKDQNNRIPKITGQPSTAMKGNILEAINLASSQFANDYIDRDLIRTGVSTIVITAGSGVFDVDRDLLNLTSQNLTNNGIGIDIVCLSKMPLHSVPLFRYQNPQSGTLSRVDSAISSDSYGFGTSLPGRQMPDMDQSSALSSYTGTSATYFSRFPAAYPSKVLQPYGYGIPHWIDLSYWSPSSDDRIYRSRKKGATHSRGYSAPGGRKPFVPRVRMYELQMMGLMELGMADMSIPYIAEAAMRSKGPRHQRSADFAQLPLARSLSQSPSYFRKSSALTLRQKDSIAIPGHKFVPSNNTLMMMDEYDDTIFADINKPKVTKPVKKRNSKKDNKTNVSPKSTLPQGQGQSEISEKDFSYKAEPSSKPLGMTSISKAETTSHKPRLNQNPPRISRSISYALRGLAAPLRSMPSTDTSMETIKATPAIATTNLTQANAATASVKRAGSIRSSERWEFDNRSIVSSDSGPEHSTKPISIRGSGLKAVSQQVSHKLEIPVHGRGLDKIPAQHQNTESDAPLHPPGDEGAKEKSPPHISVEPVQQSNLPFIRNVNASNPVKKQLTAASVFGRWQHLYPHKPRASIVKWRSLCTPASVPLTTEDFPTPQELSDAYHVSDHRIQVRSAFSLLEESTALDLLLFEMIVLRLSHGYQIIIGDAARKYIGNTLCEVSVFMDPSQLSKYGDSVLMSMGNTIQKLSFNDPEFIYVTKFVKKDTDGQYPFSPVYSYTPNIRTILATEYSSRPMELRGFSEEYPWETADNYLAYGEPDASSQVKKLRFWRARFILLPVEPPASNWRPQQSSDENEEEIHLLGIRALTQMWQRARHFGPHERKAGPGRLAANKKQDLNPLEIRFDTLNPSELITTELDKLLALEESGEMSSIQLLPDSEKLDRETSMTKLAQAMQGDKGIEIKNRRWHFRLHYNCFHGEEFTNWLVANVKSIENRADAIEYGNQLMKEELFEHVNGRHHFKDGNYFYSLKPEFKVPKMDLKGSWFSGARRSDKSIPPTPISEHTIKDGLQVATRSRSGSSLAHSLHPPTPLEASRPFLERRKKTVTLTKMIKIDVDPRKRSNRPEIINLHYDRFHNPGNCYHIELSWLNATSKLVDDAIVTWTGQAERYGLKLVEVPMAEASKIPNSEPFRRSYPIKLCLEPPKRSGVAHVLTSNSFTPQPSSNTVRHIYQKAILKKFNFVLDLEGVSEFPDNVEVRFSSAGLEYKYTQFVHRSGVCLAQVTDEGDLLLLANRLYNARFANAREANNTRIDNRKEQVLGPGLSHRPAVPPQVSASVQLQASGIIGLNVQSPRAMASPYPSPFPRATADVLGSRSAISNSSIAQYVTPEQIKDEIEQFCSDPKQLEQFYKEFNNAQSLTQTASGASRRSTGTSSSALKPIQDANEGIPEFVLPESVTSPNTSTSTFGINFGGLMSRRARQSVAYESVAEMFARGGGGADRADNSRERSEGGGNGEVAVGGRGVNSAETSARTSGDVSGHGDVRVRVETPGGTSRIEESIEEGMKDRMGSPEVRNLRMS